MWKIKQIILENQEIFRLKFGNNLAISRLDEFVYKNECNSFIFVNVAPQLIMMVSFKNYYTRGNIIVKIAEFDGRRLG